MSGRKAIRIGIIGAARVAVYAMLAPARDNARATVAAIAARDPARARTFAEAHGIPRIHESYEALIGDPAIDLVYVATPPTLHADVAIKALRAGKHVLVEKPFAANAAEARAILEAARMAERRAFEAFHYRHHRLWGRIVEIVRSGALGPLKTIEAGFHVPIAKSADEFRWNPRLGGGALMDLGCYALQWARVVAGEEPAVVSARMRMVDGVDAETEAVLSFPGDVEARVSCGMEGDAFRAFLNVEGVRGRMRVTNPLAPQFGHAFDTDIDGTVRSETIEGASTFSSQLEAVAGALLDGAPVPLAEDDPVKSMAAIDAVKAAAR